MAGGYPDTPGQRLAYDLDGTQLVWVNISAGSFHSQYPPGHERIVDLNNESNAGIEFQSAALSTYRLTFMFAEPKDLFALWIAGHANDNGQGIYGNAETSPDTTSYDTGTWTDTGVASWVEPGTGWDTWRYDNFADDDGFQTFSATGVWGFRGTVFGSGGLDFTRTHISQLHLYGVTNDAATPNRVIFLDEATGLEFTAVHDFGYMPRGTIKEKLVQVKNNSTTHQANAVGLNFSSLMNGTPSDYMEMKDGAGAYSTSLALGNIAADTVYANDITIKMDIGSTAGLGPVSVRLGSTMLDWT